MDSAQVFITICMFLSFAVIWTSLTVIWRALKHLHMKLDMVVSILLADKVGGIEIKEIKVDD